MPRRGRAAGRTASNPPPTAGWNTKEGLTDMPSDAAITLDNWFPETDRVTLRRGYTEWATGMSGNVDSLLEYSPATGTPELFAVASGSIYDVTTTGAVGSAVVSGLNGSQYQHVQMGTAGGQFLLAFNGEDEPQIYDGSAWAGTSITGPTENNLVWCNIHQNRLWFGEKNSLKAWYLPAKAIAGTAAEFDLSSLSSLGGYIMAMGTWTRDSGSGTDDVAVFLTSEGEAIIYNGTDPVSASTWALVGVFRIGQPIGRRCMAKAGADLVLITQDGFVTVASILMTDRSQADQVALSSNINQAVNTAQRSFSTLFGWDVMVYPRAVMMIFNIPQSATTFHQYVFNTITGAACRFTGVNARSWGLKGDLPFFGGTDGKVYQFDEGASDDGDNIEADAVQAFSYFGSKQLDKWFKSVEIVFQSNAAPNAAIEMNTDFSVVPSTTTPSQSGEASGAKWDTAIWDEDLWAGSDQVYQEWRGVRGYGRSGSVRVRITTNSSRPSWHSTNVLFIPGGVL